MMKTKVTQPALLLGDPKDRRWHISMRLQNQETAEMSFSNRDLARNTFDYFRVIGVCGGLAIRDIQFHELQRS